MSHVTLYFQLHQPYRLRNYSVFDVDASHEYFSTTEIDENKQIFLKVCKKSYLPMLQLLYSLTQWHPRFFFSISCSGVFLEQAQEYCPEIITLVQKLVDTKQVEILAETYHHSLASLYSKKEFEKQIKAHQKIIKKLFNVKPTVFRNTELIYSDEIAEMVSEFGFKGMLTEGVDRCLHGQSRTQLFASNTTKPMPLLLKQAQLSDDIAFRFSANHHAGTPLTAETFVEWLSVYHEHEYINLFMDFETFGEHQWEDTGIFQFFEHMVAKFLAHEWNHFVTPSQVFAKAKPKTLPIYYVHEPISWADIDRDLSAWRDNDLQYDTLRLIYSMEKDILASKDTQLIEDWRRLQTSDHFYYMCIKWSNDGDVHAYFSPYDSPFDAYNRYTTVLADMKSRLAEGNPSTSSGQVG